jgi:hypothetical protein
VFLGRSAGGGADASPLKAGEKAGEEVLFASAAAAAVLASRRSMTRGASCQPRRRVFSFSARVGREAAVRSPGAVRRSPNLSSAARHASRTR